MRIAHSVENGVRRNTLSLYERTNTYVQSENGEWIFKPLCISKHYCPEYATACRFADVFAVSRMFKLWAPTDTDIQQQYQCHSRARISALLVLYWRFLTVEAVLDWQFWNAFVGQCEKRITCNRQKKFSLLQSLQWWEFHIPIIAALTNFLLSRSSLTTFFILLLLVHLIDWVLRLWNGASKHL